MAVPVDIQDLILRLREAKGLTQEQLAREVGVTFCTVNSWQNGRHKPHAVFVKILLELANDEGIKPRASPERTSKNKTRKDNRAKTTRKLSS